MIKQLTFVDFTYLFLMAGVIILRKFYTAKFRMAEKTGKSDFAGLILLGLVGIGMIAPLVYFFTGWIDFAGYTLPLIVRWLGIVIFLVSGWLLWRSHHDLGKGWTITLRTHEKHELVTDGIYTRVRHPMYSAHLLWAVANILIIPNSIAGVSFLVFIIPVLLYRIPKEEAMLVDKFGDEYREYRQRTSCIIPRALNRQDLNASNPANH